MIYDLYNVIRLYFPPPSSPQHRVKSFPVGMSQNSEAWDRAQIVKC